MRWRRWRRRPAAATTHERGYRNPSERQRDVDVCARSLFLSSGTDSGVDERFRFELVGLARGEGCKHLRACTAAGIQQTETSAGGLVLRGAAASRQSCNPRVAGAIGAAAGALLSK